MIVDDCKGNSKDCCSNQEAFELNCSIILSNRMFSFLIQVDGGGAVAIQSRGDGQSCNKLICVG